MLIYLDTNVYARPFDDQTQAEIQAEANAFLDLVPQVKAGALNLLGSDILDFEIANILSAETRAKVEDFRKLCDKHSANPKEVLQLGRRIQSDCHIRARDALHIASAIIGQARYFLSCDKKVTEMKQARCYRRLAKPYRNEYFSVMNPVRFVEKLQKGEII